MPPTRRGERTRRRIIRQCAEVFDQLGFHGATLNELVGATGLTRGAFYFHFDSKDALAAAIVSEQARLWPRLLEGVTVARPDPLARLVHFAFASAALTQSDVVVRSSSRLLAERRLIALDLPETYPFWCASVHALLAEANAAGTLRGAAMLIRPHADSGPDADPEGLGALAELLVGSWVGSQRVHEDGDLDPAGLVYAGWRIILAALCPGPEPLNSMVALCDRLADELRADPHIMVSALLNEAEARSLDASGSPLRARG
jgi:AcrR family transcriptional regulator